MCPLCIGTATLLVSSGTSAGGIAALLCKARARRRRARRSVAGGVGVAPGALEGQAPCVGSNELVDGIGTPGSGLV